MRSGSLSMLIIAIILSSAGCFQVSRVPMEEFLEEYHPRDATFHTIDSIVVRAGCPGYSLQNDTLVFSDARLLGEAGDVPFSGVVPTSNIAAVEVKTIDPEKVVIIAGSAAIVVVIVKVIDWFSKTPHVSIGLDTGFFHDKL